MKQFLPKRIFALLLTLLMLMAASGCGAAQNGTSPAPDNSEEAPVDETPSEQEPVTVKVGCLARDESTLLWVDEHIREYGYIIEPVVIADMTTMNMATEDGDLDANYAQNPTYMRTFNESNGTHLVAYREDFPLQINPDILISRKYSKPEELPDGASIVIAADGTNRQRELRVLEAAGLLTLADEYEGTFITLFDIVDNPKNLQFIDCDTATRVALFEDADAMVSPAATVWQQHDPTLTIDMSMYKEDVETASTYGGLVYVTAEGKDDAPWLPIAVELESTQEFADWLMVEREGSSLPSAAIASGAVIDWDW